MNKENLMLSYLGNGNTDDKYKLLGLAYNPFPRSGTANINDNDRRSFQLMPINQEVLDKVLKFISNSLTANPSNPHDKFQSCVIQGDYGSGKTQLLLFIRGFLREIANSPQYKENPYVIYIDNPGVSLLEFLGNIISKIGDENLRKYLWRDIIDKIRKEQSYKDKLYSYFSGQMTIFESEESSDPFSEENTVSYKKFLSTFIHQIGTLDKRKRFDKDFRDILMEILINLTKDSIVANYFYEFLSTDYGVNKAWEGLINGDFKQLSGKEASIIQYIVHVVKEDGFSDFFILVDEFEDITEGRLTKVQLDNYIYNLRTLLDEQREWALFFSMSPLAYKKLRKVSPPLADRISTCMVTLNSLDEISVKNLVNNYMVMAGSEGIGPFTEEALESLIDKVDSNVRRFLTHCFNLIEDAAREFKQNNQKIDLDFVNTHIAEENE